MTRKDFSKRLAIGLFIMVWVIGFGGIAQAAPKSIKISAVIPLTGVFSSTGVPLKIAYELIAEKINKEGGIYIKEYGNKLPVELKIMDDESNGQKTQTQLETANSWGAVANLGGLGCSSFELGTPICAKNKLVWIGPGCGGWNPHQIGNKWLFSIFEKTKFVAPMPFDMILENPQQKPRKVAIFEINQLDCQEAVSFMQPFIKEGGFEVVFHNKYPFGTKDFSAMISEAKNAGAEILVAYPVPPEAPIILKQMKELDFNPQVTYFIRAIISTQLFESIGKICDYVVGSTPYFWDFNFPENDYLRNEYKKKIGKEPDPSVGVGYASGQALFAAIEKAGTLDRTAIRDAIRSIDMMTVAGPVKFDDKGLPVNKVLVNIQYMDGKPKMVYANPSGKKFPKEVPISPFQYQTKWSDRK
jgi:branched-chain amino acid transport system substrate-binding protein